VRIAYELQGTMRRRPWLVLIHGMGFDRSGWILCCPHCDAVSGSS